MKIAPVQVVAKRVRLSRRAWHSGKCYFSGVNGANRNYELFRYGLSERIGTGELVFRSGLGGILAVLFFMFSCEAKTQDLNHFKSFYDCSYFHQYDSLKGYYFYFQVGFNDNLIGMSQREYNAPDSIFRYVDYMTMLLDRNDKRIVKGIHYDMFPNGVFFGLGYNDWRGEKHGNYVSFRFDGTLKENKLYDRGVLMSKWRYNEAGELIEYIEYKEK